MYGFQSLDPSLAVSAAFVFCALKKGCDEVDELLSYILSDAVGMPIRNESGVLKRLKVSEEFLTSVSVVFCRNEPRRHNSADFVVIKCRRPQPEPALREDVRIVQCSTEISRLHNALV